MVARCACGEPVIGSHKQPQANRFWCAECVGFVDAAIRGAQAFHGYVPDTGIDVVSFMAALERSLIQSALDTAAGNVAAAARLLGLKRTTLSEKLKRMRGGQANPSAQGVVAPAKDDAE